MGVFRSLKNGWVTHSTTQKNKKIFSKKFCKNKNIRLSVVSNKPGILSKKILSLFQIDSYFDCIIGPEDTGKTKPAPDGLALAVELMKKNCKEKIRHKSFYKILII